MSDLKLGVDGDLEIKNGDLLLTTSDDAVRQHLQQRLRTFLGEWFLDLDVGIPFFQRQESEHQSDRRYLETKNINYTGGRRAS